MNKKNVFGVLVNAIDYQGAVDEIICHGRDEKALSVSALAVHGLMTGALNSQHRYRLNSVSLILPDGQPVRWALNILHGAKLTDRVYGPTLMLKVCNSAASARIPVFLFGSDADTLDRLKDNLQRQNPDLQIVGTKPSQFRQLSVSEKNDLVDEIKSSGARIVFVGLGCPRQEIFVYEMSSALNMPLIAVGAAFAFHAGVLPQAPPLMQKMGLEWLFRLYKEPGRLWQRYLFYNSMFLLFFLLQLSGIRNFKATRQVKPSKAHRYG